MLRAPPGTRLEERLEGEGRLRGRMSGDNVDGSTNIVPEMGFETLRSDTGACSTRCTGGPPSIVA